ncbi:MAG: Putative pterin-4-alpha-carbinolamine dehydratase [Owenweeksia sp. TMED14]|nr:MAG: Putative pterin-4-alpha-carbinolamine dehydratase [Owenweeksia sp. TMED14]
MKKLTDFEIEKELKFLPGWGFYDNFLHADFKFDNFKVCISVINRIAFECESLNHHPEWTNSFNTLNIKLTTHDVGGVTSLDFKLASIIKQIVEGKLAF